MFFRYPTGHDPVLNSGLMLVGTTRRPGAAPGLISSILWGLILYVIVADVGVDAFVSVPWIHGGRAVLQRSLRAPPRSPVALHRTITAAVSDSTREKQSGIVQSQAGIVIQARNSPVVEVPEWARLLEVVGAEGEAGAEMVELISRTQDQMTYPVKEAVFNITKKNMADMYEYSSWGWSDENKWLSINNTEIRFILAFRQAPPGR